MVEHNQQYAALIDTYLARHRVKPGITGWAQVNGWRGETDTLEKMEGRIRHDLYYIENWSLGFDLRILGRTLLVGLHPSQRLLRSAVVRPGHQTALGGVCLGRPPSRPDPAEPEVSIIIPTFQRPDEPPRRAAQLPDAAGRLRRDRSRSSSSTTPRTGPPRRWSQVWSRASSRSATSMSRGPGSPVRRNAGFANARGRFLALIDDDEQASPDWLAHLTRAQRTCDADVVFGPVYPEFDPLPERDLALSDAVLHLHA